MSTLLFYDDSHKYTVDGKEVPSVSELTRFLTRELYNDAPQYFLDQAAKRGTRIHKATEAIDKFGTVEIEDEYAGFVKAYVSFLKDHNVSWEKIEWPVCRKDDEMPYAGTIDRVGTLDGKTVILDIKTTANISGLHKLCYTAQLNLYRLAIKEKLVDELWVLQLKKDGTYKLIQLEENKELAQACLTMHYAIQKTKRKRRKKNAEN
jgi:ATP-dependent exoDNAse (exonuclease V) beta subunit